MCSVLVGKHGLATWSSLTVDLSALPIPNTTRIRRLPNKDQTLPSRRTPPPTPPDLSPEKAYAVLSRQLESLQALKHLEYQEGKPKEKEWAQLTGNIIARAFASDSHNRSHFAHAGSAGDYFITTDFGYAGEDHALNQRNYAARIQAYEG